MKTSKRKRAVALRYQPGKDAAPRVTAKGEGLTAENIIEIAKKHNVPIKDDPDLVEVLSRVDIQSEIPPDIYVAVAELLAFVYAINRKKSPV